MPDAYGSVGAMTHSFVRAVEYEPRGVTYGRLLTSMRTIMKCGGGGGYDDLQGPIGAPMQHHQVANFSGVQVSDGLRSSSDNSLSIGSMILPFHALTEVFPFCRWYDVAGAKPVVFGDVRHLPQALRPVMSTYVQ